MIVPNACLPLLKLQRTDHDDVSAGYVRDLQATYESIKAHLPKHGKILDIGCGMAGINVFLSRHYRGVINLTLLDKQGVSPVVNAGFNAHADDFAHYHDFGAALMLLAANGVEVRRCIDIAKDGFPDEHFDLAISLLSWGFHYPIDTYFPDAKIIIADIRKGTDGEKRLARRGKLMVVHDSKKYRRVVVEC